MSVTELSVERGPAGAPEALCVVSTLTQVEAQTGVGLELRSLGADKTMLTAAVLFTETGSL